jgi:hypothetical protein
MSQPATEDALAVLDDQPATALFWVLACFSGLAVMAIVCVWKFLPETKGLAVEDIVRLFAPGRQSPAPGEQPAPVSQ